MGWPSPSVNSYRSAPEHRAKISAARKGQPANNPWLPETRAKMAGNRNRVDAPVKGECVYWGEPATEREHVIPRGRPGSEDLIVLACRRCNNSKGQRTPDEWLERGLYQ